MIRRVTFGQIATAWCGLGAVWFEARMRFAIALDAWLLFVQGALLVGIAVAFMFERSPQVTRQDALDYHPRRDERSGVRRSPPRRAA